MRNIIRKSNTNAIVGVAFFIAVIVTLLSCEKEVKINLDSGEPRLVVEGAIETGLPPYVFLTKSIGYFATIDLNTLQNSFVHGAKVTVSDGSRSVDLIEYTVDTGNGYKFSFYTIDTAGGNFFVGQVNKYYTLRVEYEGKIYEAVTKIPEPTALDSVVSVQPDAPFDKEKFPEARQIRIYFKDPDTMGNYVRYYTRRNSEPYYPGLNATYSDEIINGTQFETTLPLGEPQSQVYDADSSGIGYVGDTVTLKWCAIDKASYNFWSTYEFSLGTIGNPFSTPIKVKTNISNNGLGIWAGYGAVYKTIILE
jgi:hypothetical protein